MERSFYNDDVIEDVILNMLVSNSSDREQIKGNIQQLAIRHGGQLSDVKIDGILNKMVADRSLIYNSSTGKFSSTLDYDVQRGPRGHQVVPTKRVELPAVSEVPVVQPEQPRRDGMGNSVQTLKTNSTIPSNKRPSFTDKKHRMRII